MSKRSAYRQFPNVSKFLDEKLVLRRKALKLTQTELAERAGVTRNCIQQLECHEHLPLPSTMFRLIHALRFNEEETAAFWVGINAAYMKDRELQEKTSQTKQEVI